MFRLVCELTEPVDGDCLQAAANEALAQYRLFGNILKRGLFWYYLEESDAQPVVTEEYKKICARLYYKDSKQLLFEVTYFKSRINLEMYHVLADGTGAMQFFKALIINYLSGKHGHPRPPDDYDASIAQQQADSFTKHYKKTAIDMNNKNVKALHIKGKRVPDDRLSIICGRMNAQAALNEAHSMGVTLTAYLCALLMAAVIEDAPVRDLARPIVACIPVNLRKYFKSGSLRNFFKTILVSYRHEGEASLPEIAAHVQDELRGKLRADELERGMNGYVALEENILAKMIPLTVKDLALKYAYHQDQGYRTFTLSNVGVIALPAPFDGYVRAVDIYSSTNTMQVNVCTFRDTLSVSFSSPYVGTDIQKNFFRRLAAAGVEVEITANSLRE